MHEIRFVSVFDSCILVIVSKTFKFTPSFLFETHSQLDKSSRVLQLSSHLSKLTINNNP